MRNYARSSCAFPLWGLAVLAAAGGVSCTVGPEYTPPAAQIPAEFRFASEDAGIADELAWWGAFGDPVLDALIEEALRENRDIRVAAARVNEFAARIGVARAGQYPTVGYAGDGTRQQGAREFTSDRGGERVSDLFNAGLNFSWEIDVFGRIRRAENAAIADLGASAEDRRGVVLSLIASVANAYISLRSLDAQLEVSRAKLQTREESVRIFELRAERGVISGLELAQVRSEYERTAASIPALERQIAIAENGLSVLLGRAPAPVTRGKAIVDLEMPQVPRVLPSDLLQRRPDLRGAERSMIAANERVGVAVASFYPSFSLSATLGLASSELADLFDDGSDTFAVSGSVLGPLFTGGRLESELGIAEARLSQAVEAYRQSILTALRETNDALVTRSTAREEAEAQQRQVDALRSYAELAEKRYDNGFVGYIEVLDAERDLFDAELERIRRVAARHAATIDVYKALGGPWVEEAERISDEAMAADTLGDADE